MSEGFAILFPGQGSQEVGMGRKLAEAEPAAARVFALANEVLGYDLARLCFEGPREVLDDTATTQPALFATSLACFEAFLEKGRDPVAQLAAGHSVGEYAALVAAGALDFDDGLRLVEVRGRAMKAAGEAQPGGMAAILGLEDDAVEGIIRDIDPSGNNLAVANYNSPQQVVISGSRKEVDRATALAQERGASRVVPLSVSVAAHSPLMEEALEPLRIAIEETTFTKSAVPVIGNITGEALLEPDEIKEELSLQLVRTVQWTWTVQRILQNGVKTFLEIGPGRVLSGLVRRTDRQARTLQVSDPESLEAAVSALGRGQPSC